MLINTAADRCVGAGQCMMAAPDYFDLDDAGTITVLRAEVDAADEDDVTNAVELCPAKAISTHGGDVPAAGRQ